MAQALTFTSDFKLGHYMKVPQRPMFWAQVRSCNFRLYFSCSVILVLPKVVATIIAGTAQLGVQAWMFTNIEYVVPLIYRNAWLRSMLSNSDMCAPDQKDGWGYVASYSRIWITLSLYSLSFICPSTEVFGTASIIVSERSIMNHIPRSWISSSGASCFAEM